MTSRRPTSHIIISSRRNVDRATFYWSSASVFVLVKLVVEENIYHLGSERKKLFFFAIYILEPVGY